jgi:hypothetical protein
MKNIICKIKGHNLKRLDPSFSLVDEYFCTNCKREFTTDGYGQLVHLNASWKKNNSQFKKNID